jgi:hypothetical protein
MSSRYLSIFARQSPFPFNVDANNRTMFSTNFDAVVDAPSDQVEQEIAKLILTAGLATALGTDLFIGPAAVIPSTGPGPFTLVLLTGGLPPIDTHGIHSFERPSFQVVVRGLNYIITRNRALAIWRALHRKVNVTVAA